MNLKQLKLNVDKSAFLLFGANKQIKEIRNYFENPLTLCGKEMEESFHEKYLGDHLLNQGLSKTINFTVQQRYWLTVSATMEIWSFSWRDEYWSDTLGVSCNPYVDQQL